MPTNHELKKIDEHAIYETFMIAKFHFKQAEGVAGPWNRNKIRQKFLSLKKLMNEFEQKI